ncbi:hypothetical protein BDV95DRAFT_485431 [Massariosphaeria phaeospora]|uniref:Uncharacterized protein n=1 Tax=Massariosphaeria phaeospora TaxID=100035 RepID=A0A7C8MDM8_9PLEO|nr:hypothetical protein BDV95DRAFT_485431 [Massariosphaeria phaeospora]
MPELQPNAYALLESSFQASSNLRSHKPLTRPRDDLHSFLPAAQPLKHAVSFADDDTASQISYQQLSPLASPGLLNGADTGLPPTPPSNSQDEAPPSSFSPPPHADGVVSSLMAKKSSLSTPVNQRSPPTPDPSPPRTTESMKMPSRPILFPVPSSRAESFKTAREDQFSSDGGDSRTSTPLADRLSTVNEDRGLGLAFEQDDNDITPTTYSTQTPFMLPEDVREDLGTQDDMLSGARDIPNREWNTAMMRNVTVRKKRNSKSSPRKGQNFEDTTMPPAGSTPRRHSGLRDRVEASKNSPATPSIENFAHSIGWPDEVQGVPKRQDHDVESQRRSSSSLSSTVVEAMVIVTPPQRRRTLRHSGKNLAYRKDPDSPTDHSSATPSHRNSMTSEDVPLHRLIHKRASISDRRKRMSVESDTLGLERTGSPLSIRKQRQDSAASTLAHQESVRRILQPAADIMSRSNSLTRSQWPERTYHKRIGSAPETIKRQVASPGPPSFLKNSPPQSPRSVSTSVGPPRIERTSPSTAGFSAHDPSPISPRLPTRSKLSEVVTSPLNTNKSLPELPTQSAAEPDAQEAAEVQETDVKDETRPPSALLERVRHLLEAHEGSPSTTNDTQEPHESLSPATSRPRATSNEAPPSVRRGSLSTRGRSEERRRSSLSQERTSTSRDTLLRPSLDQTTEEFPRNSHEWYDHRRVSFDRSTIRTEEHAMARHLFAQTTPFSQFSDTPIEVSEATAVSIYPHNNHSVLVVQQAPRSSMQVQIVNEAHFAPPASVPTPPFVDASEGFEEQYQQPTLTFEPSTPPMQISLPVPGVVDSPLKNPRKPPEPPSLKVIPPTPAEELERQLPPGPPKRSESHPQRRLSLVQRARRYSDNLISPLLARASSTRGRHAIDSHTHENPRIPTVNDEEGTLHPFWRPRGFWDGFEDSDSESDDDMLPRGGDTSDVEDPEPEPVSLRRRVTLTRRLTSGLKGSSGFLIGNSLGVERAGTNKRRPHIPSPSHHSAQSPAIMIQPPTLPLRTRSPRIEKSGSRGSMRSSGSGSFDLDRRASRRDGWRRGKTIPVLNMQVQYIGLSGVKERLRERKAEKRRNEIRRSIGSRYYVEPGAIAS